MTTREAIIPRQLVITINRIWQRCSNPSYVATIKRWRELIFDKNANRIAAVLMTVASTLMFIAIAELAWVEVLSFRF